MLQRKISPHSVLQNDQCFILLNDADILMNTILLYDNHTDNFIKPLTYKCW